MEPTASSSEWTKERVIRGLKREREKLDKSPSKRDVSSSLVSAARRLFGSWNNAKEEAGLETFDFKGKGGENWSKEKIVKKLREMAEKLGRPPVIADDRNLAQAAQRHFGSWNDAKRVAGLGVFPSSEGRNWSKEKVIQELKRLAERVGRTPKRKDDSNLEQAASRWFGSWNRALEAAGVDSIEPKEDSIPIAQSEWENRKETLRKTAEEVEDALPSDSIEEIKEDAIGLLRSIGSARGYSLQELILGCLYLSCRFNGAVIFPKELTSKVLDREDGKAVEEAAKIIRREADVPSPRPFKLEKVVERFARSAGFGEKALKDAVELAKKSANKLSISGRSRKSLAAAVLYIVSCLHPGCERLTQSKVGDICNVTGVSIRNTLAPLCEELERDDLPFTPCPPKVRCSDAVAEAFLAPEEAASMVRREPTKWSKEKVIRNLRDLADELGRTPKVEDDFALATAARSYFGSWSQAKRKAGLEILKPGEKPKWSKEKVIRGLQDLADELGRSPKTEDNPALAAAARRWFGSWNRAKRKAGLEVLRSGKEPRWSREKVIHKLRDLANELGRTPKAADDPALYSIARKRFDSWSDAKKEAGVEFSEKGEEWVKSKIIQELQNLADKLGRPPRVEDDQGLTSAAISHFGSWNRAKEKAGLEAPAPSESVKGD